MRLKSIIMLLLISIQAQAFEQLTLQSDVLFSEQDICKLLDELDADDPKLFPLVPETPPCGTWKDYCQKIALACWMRYKRIRSWCATHTANWWPLR